MMIAGLLGEMLGHLNVTEQENGDPYGNRTRVSAVKGPRPRPLDEGATTGCAVGRPRL